MCVEPRLGPRVPRSDQSQDASAQEASVDKPSPSRQVWEGEIETAPAYALPGPVGSKGWAPLPGQPMPRGPSQAAEREANLFSPSLRAVECPSPTKAYFEFHKMKLPFPVWISAVFMLIPTLLMPLFLGARQKYIVLRKKTKEKDAFRAFQGTLIFLIPGLLGQGTREGVKVHTQSILKGS